MPQNTTEIISFLSSKFGLNITDASIEEKVIILALRNRIEELIQYKPDELFSLLYRLDISEKKLKLIMKSSMDLSMDIAKLIYERQLEKINSRQKFK